MIFEILIFATAGIGALFVTGYAVHMFVGGLVSAETEHQLIVVICALAACAMAYMVWDVVQRRSGKK
jgi:membrane protein implicated in regulation of membrane protease activity